jgi:hypothetical protein
LLPGDYSSLNWAIWIVLVIMIGVFEFIGDAHSKHKKEETSSYSEG